MKSRLGTLLFLIIILIGCESTHIIDNKTTDILILEDGGYKKSEDLVLLDNSKEISSNIEFAYVHGFTPDESYVAYEYIGEESFLYINLDNRNKISGTLIFENANDYNVQVKNIFVQGNDNVKASVDGEEWYNVVSVEVPGNKRVEVDIDILFTPSGLEELSLIQVKETDGGSNEFNVGINRFYVNSGKGSISESLLEDHVNNRVRASEGLDVYPSLSFIKNEEENKIVGIQVEAIAREDTVDILLMNSEGEISIFLEKINLHQQGLSRLFNNKEKMNINKNDYLIMLNNRGNHILADVKTIMESEPNYLTTHEQIIKIRH